MPLSEKFPRIEIDSERGSASSRENIVCQSYDSFQNILSRDPFYLNVLSAEVLRIEDELLDQPDGDIGTFSQTRRRRTSQSNVQVTGSTLHHVQPDHVKEGTLLDENAVKENKSLHSNRVQLERANLEHHDQNGQSERDDTNPREVAVDVLLNVKNPVAGAILPGWSESTDRSRSSIR